MSVNLVPDMRLIRLAWACKCPKCEQGNLFNPGLAQGLRDKCERCGLDLAAHDIGDGPAVFLIFILGFTLVPAAVLFEHIFEPALWVHGIVWTITALTLTLGSLRPLKAYIIALQYKHRPGEWASEKSKDE